MAVVTKKARDLKAGDKFVSTDGTGIREAVFYTVLDDAYVDTETNTVITRVQFADGGIEPRYWDDPDYELAAVVEATS